MFGRSETEQAPDLEAFVIYDSKSESYSPIPMFSYNHLTYIRETEALFRDPGQEKNQLVANSEDFKVFRIGRYYRKTGKFIAQEPEHIANMHEIQASVRSQILREMGPQPVVDPTEKGRKYDARGH